MTHHVQRLAAVAATAVATYEQHIRGSGRTEELVRIVEPGDQIVVLARNEKRYLEDRLRAAGKAGVHVVVQEAGQGLDRIRPATDGRTYFESSWCHSFFLGQLEEISRSFHQFQRSLDQGADQPRTREEISYRGNWRDNQVALEARADEREALRREAFARVNMTPRREAVERAERAIRERDEQVGLRSPRRE